MHATAKMARLKLINLSLVLYALVAQQVSSIEDACTGKGVRPVLLIPGFLGSPLYNKTKNYKVEWPDFDAFGVPYGPGKTDLDLDMVWSGLEQAPVDVGPERSADDTLPSLDGLFGELFEFTVC